MYVHCCDKPCLTFICSYDPLASRKRCLELPLLTFFGGGLKGESFTALECPQLTLLQLGMWRFILKAVHRGKLESLVLLNFLHRLWRPDIPLLVNGKVTCSGIRASHGVETLPLPSGQLSLICPPLSYFIADSECDLFSKVLGLMAACLCPFLAGTE